MVESPEDSPLLRGTGCDHKPSRSPSLVLSIILFGLAALLVLPVAGVTLGASSEYHTPPCSALIKMNPQDLSPRKLCSPRVLLQQERQLVHQGPRSNLCGQHDTFGTGGRGRPAHWVIAEIPQGNSFFKV